ncbi:Hypothetical protein NTJ_04847 [Nesidiocoris tenuis]|uniref:Uncharacterized protein n=1 Tax=Nesidiocoris tenuis TaxID=355587 RepID=A0ABN7ALD7_9HEMI|nr:Hypothetical protein NTJ_04847 [Nesidiocoris tenuis]
MTTCRASKRAVTTPEFDMGAHVWTFKPKTIRPFSERISPTIPNEYARRFKVERNNVKEDTLTNPKRSGAPAFC